MDRPCVLIIDDDPDFRELVRIYLEGAGAEVLEAEDCVRGIAVLRAARERVTLVLLDYWMPNMEPVECAEGLRALVRPEADIVLVSAAVDISRRAVDLGLSKWLAKPFALHRLSGLLGEARGAPSTWGPA